MKIRIGKKWGMVVTGIVLSVTALIAGRNLLHVLRTKRDIRALEREKRFYLEKIEQDSTLVERLRFDEYLEEYARERFRMQRRDEQVFIIEE